jgi:3-hydroxyisobutyrate dehydrogenase-like beta-hydroxyacid dehydrogenase
VLEWLIPVGHSRVFLCVFLFLFLAHAFLCVFLSWCVLLLLCVLWWFHQGATEGTLTFMVGCDKVESLELAQPYFNAMGQRTIPCGLAGAGATTKLCNNLALAAQMLGICEAMNLGDQLGVDPIVLAQVLNTSTASSWSSTTNNPHPMVAALSGSPAANHYQGGFGTKLMHKDLGLAVSAGAQAGVVMPMGGLAKELYQLAEVSGLGDRDFGVMLQFLRGKKP